MTTTHTIDVEAERRSFEQDLIATCKAQGDSDEYATLILQRSLLGDYSTVFVQARFDGWLAAKRSIQPTIAAEERLQNVWDDALEEAVLICDQQAKEPECPERAQYCADEIRALKGRAIAATTTPKGEA